MAKAEQRFYVYPLDKVLDGQVRRAQLSREADNSEERSDTGQIPEIAKIDSEQRRIMRDVGARAGQLVPASFVERCQLGAESLAGFNGWAPEEITAMGVFGLRLVQLKFFSGIGNRDLSSLDEMFFDGQRVSTALNRVLGRTLQNLRELERPRTDGLPLFNMSRSSVHPDAADFDQGAMWLLDAVEQFPSTPNLGAGTGAVR
jgi:hypothetical protein